jgi:ABC-type multidrug transport system ATPase subunit
MKTMDINMQTPLLEVRQLELSFQEKVLLSDLNFSLRPGQKISVQGKSGSGKSTLLKCILGFTPPKSGSVLFAGEELSASNIWTVRRRIGYVPQEPDLGDLEVSVFLEKPYHYKANQSRSLDRSRLVELFEAFHLEPELLHKSSRLLSGGEKQRIALISALLLKRELYLFDEATSALDVETRLAVVEYLRAQEYLTALFVTHDQDLLALSSEVLTIGNNRNVER